MKNVFRNFGAMISPPKKTNQLLKNGPKEAIEYADIWNKKIAYLVTRVDLMRVYVYDLDIKLTNKLTGAGKINLKK